MFNFFKKTDSQIQQDVMNEIEDDPTIKSTQVHVSVEDGIATLRGNVPQYTDKSHAEEATQRVGGVRAVVDEIEVNIMGSYIRSDEQIAEAALSALKWSFSAPTDVKVTVEKGWITLKGEAEWDYQRRAAKSAVYGLMGVSGVTNLISLHSKTHVKASDIKHRIEKALKRSAENEGQKIFVDVQDNKVTLSGNVHSFSESEVARHAAWMFEGIVSVDNNIKISN